MKGRVRKRIVDKNGKATTVWVRIDGNLKLKKQKKATSLMRSYNTITRKLNADINNGGEQGDLASVVRVMMHTGIRVGNEKSASGYKSLRDKKIKRTYGLTTLNKEHVKFDKDGVLISFKGKRNVQQNIRIKDKSMVGLVKRFYDAAKDGGRLVPFTPYEIAKYVKSRIGKQYTPKDLRMVRANREAIVLMRRVKKKPLRKTKGEVNQELNEIMDKVAAALGNTRGVAKRSYVSQFLIDDFKIARYKRPKKRRKSKG